MKTGTLLNIVGILSRPEKYLLYRCLHVQASLLQECRRLQITLTVSAVAKNKPDPEKKEKRNAHFRVGIHFKT